MVCGHIHKAEVKDIDGIVYGNCGDWVESLSALVEHHDGRLEIVHWTQQAGDRIPQSIAANLVPPAPIPTEVETCAS
ncbi:hypothetical protein D3C85_1211140 [compost metagenome]